jgi:hypothetical protein
MSINKDIDNKHTSNANSPRHVARLLLPTAKTPAPTSYVFLTDL